MPYRLKVKDSIFFKIYTFFSFILFFVFLFIHFFLLKNFERMTVYQFKIKTRSEVELLTKNFIQEFKNYKYSELFSTVNTLLKSDPDLALVSLYQFSPSNKILEVKRNPLIELPLCNHNLLESPCFYREVKKIPSTLPIYVEVLYSTQRIYRKFELLRIRLIAVEVSSFLILFIAFLVSYFLLKRRTTQIIELFENWQSGNFSKYKPKGKDEFSIIENKFLEMYDEIEREHSIDEKILNLTSYLLKLLIETKDENTFIKCLESKLKEILRVEVKVIRGNKIEKCEHPVSLINNKDITICFKGQKIPDHFLSILLNIIDMIFLAFRERVEKEKLFLQTITALANAIDAISPWTKGHSQRVAEISVLIGKEMGLKEEELEKLRIAGILHDIGKIGVDKEIIDKRGKLTPKEYEEVKRHSTIGYEILRPIELLNDILPAVLYHHERCNGSGYPEGLKCKEIPSFAKIIAVADVIEALSAERPYKKSYSPEEVLKHLVENKGTLYDPEVVEAAVKAWREIEELLPKKTDPDKLS
ncbi:MAG: HD-GYP domain-containing protein [Desulfurobacteriaceae bacterium]